MPQMLMPLPDFSHAIAYVIVLKCKLQWALYLAEHASILYLLTLTRKLSKNIWKEWIWYQICLCCSKELNKYKIRPKKAWIVFLPKIPTGTWKVNVRYFHDILRCSVLFANCMLVMYVLIFFPDNAVWNSLQVKHVILW